MPQEVRRQVWKRLRAGATWREVQAEFECSHQMLWIVVREAGGMPVIWPQRASIDLSFEEREEISRGLTANATFAEIGRRLSRPGSTISREVGRNGGRQNYRAVAADRSACERAKRPKRSKLEQHPVLARTVEAWLRQGMSPEQIAGRLIVEFPDDDTMRIVHETIYQALFVQGRGGLNKELVKCLRTHRPRRRPRTVTARNESRISDMVLISDRPAEIEDRAVPGHWEGDLIIGQNGHSQVGTLVERTTGLVLLIQLPDDRFATTVAAGLQRQIATLPVQSCRSITWDQGVEMARHATFSVATGIPVYFAHPHSPWERGTNENTNGLLREYLPKGTDLSVHSQADLDDIAARLNNRPRKRHAFLTPSEMFNQTLVH
jgi:IS30 family transposase